jgi:hypothetical protein
MANYVADGSNKPSLGCECIDRTLNSIDPFSLVLGGTSLGTISPLPAPRKIVTLFTPNTTSFSQLN